MRDFKSPDPHWSERAYENRFVEQQSTEEEYGISDEEINRRIDEWDANINKIIEITYKEFDVDDILIEKHVRDNEYEEYSTVTNMTFVFYDENEKKLTDDELKNTVDQFMKRFDKENITYLNTFKYNGAELRTETWDSFSIEVPDFYDPR